MFGKKEMKHKFTIEHSMWSDDLRNALYDTDSPVTSQRYVIEEDDRKVILYDITIIGDNDVWDQLNRELGRLGINTYKKKIKPLNKVKN